MHVQGLLQARYNDHAWGCMITSIELIIIVMKTRAIGQYTWYTKINVYKMCMHVRMRSAAMHVCGIVARGIYIYIWFGGMPPGKI